MRSNRSATSGSISVTVMDTALLELCDANHAESCREVARWTAQGEICESGGLLLAAPVTRAPPFQYCLRVGPGQQPTPAELLARADAFFFARDRGYVVNLRAHADADLEAAAGARGLGELVAPLPVMVLERQPGGAAPGAVRLVDSAAGIADFAAVAAQAYAPLGLAPSVTARIMGEPARMTGPGRRYAVAYQDGRPAAAAMLLLSHGIAGLYWVGTVPEARGRGLAEAVTRTLCEEAFAAGAPLVVLQASPQGRPVYARVGFREVSSYRRLLVPRPSR